MWTPYAGGLDKEPACVWHHVTRLDDHTDTVALRDACTHSVTLFRLPPGGEGERVLVTDCSVNRGVFTVDIDTVISTAASMTAMVRVMPGYNAPSILATGLDGVKDDEYNVVFFPDAPSSPPPAQGRLPALPAPAR